MELNQLSNIHCVPPNPLHSFQDQLMAVFSQLNTQTSSFLSSLDEIQLLSLTKICKKHVAPEGQVVMKEGEMAEYLAIVLIGRLSVDQFGKRAACMKCGDTIGEVELCQAGTNGRRFATVVALEDSVLADIPNDAFLAFVEGLGSRMAKKVSRYMADLVLAQVISHEAEAGRDDRRRLENIGRVRRMAISGPPAPAAAMAAAGGGGGGGEPQPEECEDAADDADAISNVPSREARQEMIKAVRATFDRIHVLSSMDEELKRLLIKEFRVVAKAHGEAVATKGEPSTRFYIVHRGNCGIYVPNILRADKRKEGLAKASSVRAGAPMGYSHRSIGTARSQHDAGSSPQDTARSGDKPAPAGARHTISQKGGMARVEAGDSPGIGPRVGSSGQGGASELVRRMPSSGGDLPPRMQRLESSSGVTLDPPVLGRTGRLESSMNLSYHPDPVAAASAAAAASALLDEFVGTPRRGEEGSPGADGLGASVGYLTRGESGQRDRDAAALRGAAAELEGDSAMLMSSRYSKMTMTHASPRRVVNAALVIGHLAAFTSGAAGNLRRRKKEAAAGDPFEGLECAKALGPGAWLCEMALVHAGRHEATVICHGPATFLALDHARLHRVRLRFEQARLARARTLVEHAPFGWALSAEDVCAVAEAGVTVSFPAGATVFSEGDSGSADCYFLVAEGSTVETRGDAKHRREVATYRAGDSFCEWALFSDPEVALDELRSAPVVVAAEACTCLRIDRLALTLLLGTYEDLLFELQARTSGGAHDRRGQHHHSGPRAGVGMRAAGRTIGHRRHGDSAGEHHFHRRRSSPEPLDGVLDTSGRWSPRRRMWDGQTSSPRRDCLATSPRRRPAGQDTAADPRISPRRKPADAQPLPEMPPPRKIFNDGGERRRQRAAINAAAAAVSAGVELGAEALPGQFSLPPISEGGGGSMAQTKSGESSEMASKIDGGPGMQVVPEDGSEEEAATSQEAAVPVSVYDGQGSSAFAVIVDNGESGSGCDNVELNSDGLNPGNAVAAANSGESGNSLPDGQMTAAAEEEEEEEKLNWDAVEQDGSTSAATAEVMEVIAGDEDQGDSVKPLLTEAKENQDKAVHSNNGGAELNPGSGCVDDGGVIPSASVWSVKDILDEQQDAQHEALQAKLGSDLPEIGSMSATDTVRPSSTQGCAVGPSGGNRYPFDYGAAPGTPGELPKTPGGTVLLSTQGRSAAPPFKSPSVTPSQSRVGSSHGLPQDRRARSTASHAVVSADEFSVPAAARRRGSDDDLSDDGDAADRSAQRSSGGLAAAAVPKIRLRRGNGAGLGDVLRPKSMLAVAAGAAGGSSIFPRIREASDAGGWAGGRPRGEFGSALAAGRDRSKTSLGLSAPVGPGPGAYELKARRDLGCVRIGLSERRFVWDDTHRAASRMPGPGQYDSDIGSIKARVAARRTDGKNILLQRLELQARFSFMAGGHGGDSAVNAVSGVGAGMSWLEDTVVRCIERHGGQHYSELPAQSELCYELRGVDAVRRAYRDKGVDL